MRKNWEKVKFRILKKKAGEKAFFESKLLKLNSNKAKKFLNWECKLTFRDTIKMVVWWYKNFYTKKINAEHLTLTQINSYEKIIKN